MNTIAVRVSTPVVLSCLALALAVAALPAQRTVTVPKTAAGTFDKRAILAPFGRTKFFGQWWYRGDSLPPVMPVSHIGFRARPNVNYNAMTMRVEIVLDSSTLTAGTLTKNFAGNLSARQSTFFKLATINVPAVSRNSDPNKPTNWIPGNQPWVYFGPSLLVQTDVQTSATPQNTGFSLDAQVLSAIPQTYVRGTSCGLSRLISSYGRGTYTINLSSAPPSVPVRFHVGLDIHQQPIDLGIMGMTGCDLYVKPIFGVTVLATAAGTATLSGQVPVPANAIATFVQASHPETGRNPANYVVTNQVSAVFGRAGITNNVYNWTSFGTTAQHGPWPYSNAPVIMLK